MFRLLSLTFAGEFHGTPEQEHHVHEAPATMTLPLVVLAGLSVVAGWIGLPKAFGESADRFSALLEPIFPRLEAAAAEHALASSIEWLLLGLSVAVAVAGLLLAWTWYGKQQGRVPDRIAASAPAAYALVADKFRVDELYDAVIVRPFAALARLLWKVIDVLVIDGILNAGAFLVELAGDLLRFLQTGNVRNYALTFFLGVIALLLLVIGVR